MGYVAKSEVPSVRKVQAMRLQLAFDLSQGQLAKAERIAACPLFAVATDGMAGMHSTYAAHQRQAKMAA